MRVLSLFSGIGAHDLGLERAGMEIVGQCENDAWVEQLMGLPPGWTALPDETVSTLWATRTRRKSRK